MDLTHSTTFAELLEEKRGVIELMRDIGLRPTEWLERTVLEGSAGARVDAGELNDRVAVLVPRAEEERALDTIAGRRARRLERSLAGSLGPLRALATKVAGVHGSKDERLVELRNVVEDLAEGITDHFDCDRGETSGSSPAQHALLEALLGSARELTGGYALPGWACGTLARYYEALAALDRDLSDQMALESLLERPAGAQAQSAR